MNAKTVLITGTTSGVGRALFEHYSQSGLGVIAVNRRRVPELESRHPSARFECIDVRSTEEIAELLHRLAEARALPDLFILNAGINRIDNDDAFDLPAYRSVIDTNLYGVLNFIEPLTKLPAGPAPRHVIAVSSMASYVGNPYGLGYSTSKRALTACFDAWSEMYSGTDLVFQQVLLGPVRTSIYTMGDRFPSWMVEARSLFSGSLEGTVRAITRFALTRKKKLFYPRRAVSLYLGMWLGQSAIPGFFRGRKTLEGRARRRT
jgi:gluconate 5-dehydrogenase